MEGPEFALQRGDRFVMGRALAEPIGETSAKSAAGGGKGVFDLDEQGGMQIPFYAALDNQGMQVPRAFVRQAEFEAAVAEAAGKLAPQVVSVEPSYDYDWTGEPSVFFKVTLSDTPMPEGRAPLTLGRLSFEIVRAVQPLEEWGVLPYFDFFRTGRLAELREPIPA